MSRLIISSITRQFTMNVTAFSTPIYGTISSAQTRTAAVHFPIKITQPEIQLDVIFDSEPAFEDFQRFVRNHQQMTLQNTSLLTLTWPQRNIFNWTGVIRQFQAGGARFNYTPRARFVVDLIDSAVSARTDFASVASSWEAIYGGFGLSGSVLGPATGAEAQILNGVSPAAVTGVIGGPNTSAPTGTAPAGPVAPNGGSGILTGGG